MAPALFCGGCALGERNPGARVEPRPLVTPWSETGLVGRTLTTQHFEVHSTLTDVEFENALSGFLEAMLRRFESVAPAPAPANTRLTTYVFATRAEWAQFTGTFYPDRYATLRRIRTGGFTEGDTAVTFYATRAATLATLAHEGWHQYAHSRFAAPIPAWLNEGLACYHEALEYAGESVRFTPQRNTFRINSLRNALKTGRLLPFSELIRTNAGEVLTRRRHETVQVYYAQAWALVTFLLHGGNGDYAEGCRNMLSDIATGAFQVKVSAAGLTADDPSDAAAAAFRCYFAQPLTTLENEYQTFLVELAGY